MRSFATALIAGGEGISENKAERVRALFVTHGATRRCKEGGPENCSGDGTICDDTPRGHVRDRDNSSYGPLKSFDLLQPVDSFTPPTARRRLSSASVIAPVPAVSGRGFPDVASDFFDEETQCVGSEKLRRPLEKMRTALFQPREGTNKIPVTGLSPWREIGSGRWANVVPGTKMAGNSQRLRRAGSAASRIPLQS